MRHVNYEEKLFVFEPFTYKKRVGSAVGWPTTSIRTFSSPFYSFQDSRSSNHTGCIVKCAIIFSGFEYVMIAKISYHWQRDSEFSLKIFEGERPEFLTPIFCVSVGVWEQPSLWSWLLSWWKAPQHQKLPNPVFSFRALEM